MSLGCPARGRGPRERLPEKHGLHVPASAGSAWGWSPGLLPLLRANASLSSGDPGGIGAVRSHRDVSRGGGRA